MVIEARQVIESLGAPIWRGAISQRAAFAHALASGEAVTEFDANGAPAEEMRGLWRDLRRAAMSIARAA